MSPEGVSDLKVGDICDLTIRVEIIKDISEKWWQVRNLVSGRILNVRKDSLLKIEKSS